MDEAKLLEFIRVGWLPLPESIVPPRRPFFLWEQLPEPMQGAKPSWLMHELLRSVEALHLERIGIISKNEDRIGVLLSGGIDSGTLLYLLSTIYGPERLTAYTIDFGHYPEEIRNAIKLCNERKVAHIIERMDVHTHTGIVRECVRNLRSPTDFATQTLLISKRCAIDHTKVIVSGLGLDELFGGYKEHVFATDKDFPKVEAQLLWRAQSHYAWIQKAAAPTIDVRFPFLSQELISYCRGLERQFKCVGSQTKLLLRATMRKLLPANIIEAGQQVGTKAGFTPLIERWWKEGLGAWVEKQWHHVPLKYKLQPFMLESEAKKFFGGKSIYWRRLRMASMPIFLEEMGGS